MFHLQFENKQEIHSLSSGAEQGLPTGITGFSLQFLSSIKQCSIKLHIISQGAISAQQQGEHPAEHTALVQDMSPELSPGLHRC